MPNQKNKGTYRISSYSFRGNYSFLNLKIVANSNSCRNISISYLRNLFFAAETIQGRKLYEEIRYFQHTFLKVSILAPLAAVKAIADRISMHNSASAIHTVDQLLD